MDAFIHDSIRKIAGDMVKLQTDIDALLEYTGQLVMKEGKE